MTDFIYGCNNGNRPEYGAPLMVQDGWHNLPGVGPDGFKGRIPRMVEVPFVMSSPCDYDKSAADSGCKGCAHAPHLRLVE